MTNSLSYGDFVNNSGIKDLAIDIDNVIDQIANSNGDATHEEISVVLALDELKQALSNFELIVNHESSKASNSTKIEVLKRAVVAHQSLVRSYQHLNQEINSEIVRILHSINVIYPLFVLSEIYEEKLEPTSIEE